MEFCGKTPNRSRHSHALPLPAPFALVIIPQTVFLISEGPDMTISAPETRIVSTYRVSCDGAEGALGHPRVWLQIPVDKGWVECGYCDCKFIHEDFEGKV
jgi:uncharacterized Zn-finger protein